MNPILSGLYHALVMAWETFWALTVGFAISGALQVFVSKDRMSRHFGRKNLKTMLMATGFGAASSSCSYAAAAAARSAFKQGAALIPALAFMFASTNLVIELAAVLWILLGWRFLLANFIGAFVLIGLLWLFASIIFPKNLEKEARKVAGGSGDEEDDCGHGGHEHHGGGSGAAPGKWTQVANAFVMDWLMLWKEITIGFLIAGFLATLVPNNWWQALFLQSGPTWLRILENCIVGPLIAIASFVCSVGNLPLAAHLWSNGISFGGVISFIFADLIVLPLVVIFGKYYGWRAATYITGVFFLCMVCAGIVVDVLFSALGLVPEGPRPPSPVMSMSLQWNYTTWLDLAALIPAIVFVYLYLRNRKSPAP
ncbi:MAG: permease [Chthoniobacterales bacterium]